ncbi:MAG: hypothetical protein K2Q10_04440, partial [Rhodospirillales bacterium]|nr:hypothetical protein [Rhodospirillales bacterium]
VVVGDQGYVMSNGQAGSSGDGGRIVIEAGNVRLNGGVIGAFALGTGAGGGIVITAGETLAITGERVYPNPNVKINGWIGSASFGAGNAGVVLVEAAAVTMDGGAITARSEGDGETGYVALNIGKLVMSGGAMLDTTTLGSGGGGGILVTAKDSVTIKDGGMLADTGGSGNAGLIYVKTPDLRIRKYGMSTLTFGDGNAGDIVLDVGKLEISPRGTIDASAGSRSADGTIIVGAGRPGNLFIAASEGVVLDGAGGGIAAGQQNDGVATASIQSINYGTQPGGSITMTADSVSLRNGALITAESQGTGNAGSIAVTASGRMSMTGGSQITTRSRLADGGNIDIKANHMVDMADSRVDTAVGTGLGNGGNITIDPDFVVLNNSRIRANAFGGNGGNIRIVAGQYLSTPSSIVEASSALGISGEIRIEAPRVDAGAATVVKTAEARDTTVQLGEGCRVRGAARTSLLKTGRGGLSLDAEGAMPQFYAAERPAPADKGRQTAGLDAPKVTIACGE